MAATDSEDRSARVLNEIRKACQQFWLVIIKVAQRPAENDRVGLKVINRRGEFADVGDLRHRLFHQPGDVCNDVLQRQRGYMSLDLQLRLRVLAKFRNRY